MNPSYKLKQWCAEKGYESPIYIKNNNYITVTAGKYKGFSVVVGSKESAALNCLNNIHDKTKMSLTKNTKFVNTNEHSNYSILKKIGNGDGCSLQYFIIRNKFSMFFTDKKKRYHVNINYKYNKLIDTIIENIIEITSEHILYIINEMEKMKDVSLTKLCKYYGYDKPKYGITMSMNDKLYYTSIRTGSYFEVGDPKSSLIGSKLSADIKCMQKIINSKDKEDEKEKKEDKEDEKEDEKEDKEDKEEIKPKKKSKKRWLSWIW